MPDLTAIFAFYQALTAFSLSGALPAEAAMMAQPERDTVIRRFLSPGERRGLADLPDRDRRLRLRLGEQRFRAWESANPDIAALLRNKAERRAFGAESCA